MSRDGDRGDRDRPSWREIDRMREGKGGGGNKGSRADPDRRGPGYSKYKSDLDRLFDVGKAQGHVAHVVAKAQADAPGEGGEGSHRAGLVRACRTAESSQELFEAIDAVLAEGPLPDDLELLLRIVDHPDEAVATDALERIERLTQRNPLTRKAAFLQRLFTLEQTARTPELRGVVNRLIEDLG